MTCFAPLKGFRSAQLSETGKRPIVFNPLQALNSHVPLILPCGQCRGCRADKAKQMAIRLAHEAKMHERSSFLTLTFSDDHVPQNYSVSKRDLQLFNYRVRKHFGSGKRFYGVGEYGERTLRPHYHLAFFGIDFADDRKLYMERNGFPVWKSPTLERLWPFGHHEIGTLTPHSAGYVARYVTKKYTGDDAPSRYTRVSPVNGETYMVEPEFALSSRRPGIGWTWFERYAGDAFPSDFVIVDGRKVRPPQYYFRKKAEAEEAAKSAPRPGRILRDGSAGEATAIQRRRKAHAVTPQAKADATPARLAVREEVFRRRTERLIRPLE